MKFLVETSGEFSLLDPATGEAVFADRPCLVTASPFMQGRVALTQLVCLIPGVSDDHTDEEWVDIMKASTNKAGKFDKAAAVKAFGLVVSPPAPAPATP